MKVQNQQKSPAGIGDPDPAGAGLTNCARQSILPDDLAVVHRTQSTQRLEINVLREKPGATVGQPDVNSTGVVRVDDRVEVPRPVGAGNRPPADASINTMIDRVTEAGRSGSPVQSPDPVGRPTARVTRPATVVIARDVANPAVDDRMVGLLGDDHRVRRSIGDVAEFGVPVHSEDSVGAHSAAVVSTSLPASADTG